MKFLLGLVGVGLIVFGGKEIVLGGVAKADPRTISCHDLSAQGPGDNAHVRMTDFTLRADHFAMRQSKRQSGRAWSEAWIAAVPAGTAPALGEPYRVLLYVREDDGGDATIESLQRESAIQGTVVNEIDGIEEGVQDILDRAYFGHPTKDAWILQVGRKPKSAWLAVAAIAAGVGMLAWVARRLLRGPKVPATEPAPIATPPA